MNAQEMILVIDNESAFKMRFEEVLASFGLDSKYKLEFLAVSGRENFSSCVSKVRALWPRPILILLDIVLAEESTPDHYLDVRDLIEGLRAHLPDVPICLVTKQTHANFAPVLFWASVSDVDAIAFKQYFRMEDQEYQRYFRFTKEEFPRIIDQLREKRRRTMLGTVRTLPLEENERAQRVLDELLHPDERAWAQVSEIGACTLKNLIDSLREGADIKLAGARLSYFRPGLSGSCLLKLALPARRGDEAKAWLLKVGEEKKIRREYENHQKALQDLPHGSVPPTTKSVGFYGPWGIYGVNLVREATTLETAIIESPSLPFAEIVSKPFEYLEKVSTKQDPAQMRLWGRGELHYIKDATLLCLRALLDDNKKVFQTKCQTGAFESVKKFIVSGPGEFREYEENVYYSLGHGDLHCRNILVESSGEVLLIDFSHYGEAPIGRDLAKLYVDLVISCLDHGSSHFYDWARLPEWRIFTALDRDSKMSEQTEHFGAVAILANSLLEKRSALVKSSALTMKQHYASILYYLLLYLSYPDISCQKKALAIEWGAAIINWLEES